MGTAFNKTLLTQKDLIETKQNKMSLISLQSCDGQVFPVNIDIARQSVTLCNMIEDLGIEDLDENEIVPLPNVNAAILKKIIAWCTHYKNDQSESSEKDLEYLKTDDGTLFELILAANYLDISQLLEVCCKQVANMIKGKSAEEIRADLIFKMILLRLRKNKLEKKMNGVRNYKKSDIINQLLFCLYKEFFFVENINIKTFLIIHFQS